MRTLIRIRGEIQSKAKLGTDFAQIFVSNRSDGVLFRAMYPYASVTQTGGYTQSFQHLTLSDFSGRAQAMSMTEDEARYEEWMDEFYREHKEQAIDEFTIERLKSFYLDHPLLLKLPIAALAEARTLLDAHRTAAQVFATIAVEVGLKVALLKPVVHGLVHSESTAEMITDLTLRHTRFDFFHELLSQILAEHGGVNLTNHTRPGASKKLLSEIQEIQKCRDRIVHKGENATRAQADQAIAVAQTILEELVPEVVSNLGLHLHDGTRVCEEWICRHTRAVE